MKIIFMLLCWMLLLVGCGTKTGSDGEMEGITSDANNEAMEGITSDVNNETIEEIHINEIYLDRKDCIVDNEMFWSNITIVSNETGETKDYYVCMDIDENIYTKIEVMYGYQFYEAITSEIIALKDEEEKIIIVDEDNDITSTYCMENEYIKQVQKDDTGVTIWVQEDIETFEKNESILKALDESGNIKSDYSTEELKNGYGLTWCEFEEIKYIGGSTYELNEGGITSDYENNIHETSDLYLDIKNRYVLRIKVGNTMIGHGATSDGKYTMYSQENRVIIWNQEGETIFDSGANDQWVDAESPIGDGLFYADIGTGWNKEYCIMDYKGDVIIPLEGVRNKPYYHNGSAPISINSANGDGIPYTTFMDTSGNWLFEPVEGDFKEYIDSIEMCRVLQKDNYYAFLDKTGKKWYDYEEVRFYAKRDNNYFYVFFENGKLDVVEFVEK